MASNVGSVYRVSTLPVPKVTTRARDAAGLLQTKRATQPRTVWVALKLRDRIAPATTFEAKRCGSDLGRCYANIKDSVCGARPTHVIHR